jgi:hypothetical protein
MKDFKFPPLSEHAQKAVDRKSKLPTAEVPTEPLDIDAAFQAGLASQHKGDDAAAEAQYKAILAQQPDEPEVLTKYAALLGKQWRWEESLDCCLRALEIMPMDGAAWCQATAAYAYLGRRDEAGEASILAVRFAPNMPAAEWNFALWLIQNGHWETGWNAYRWGRVTGVRRNRTLLPEWSLEYPFRDVRTMFVWAEQGVGDTIQMLQLLPMLKKRTGARIILEVPEQLLALIHGQTCADFVHRAYDDGRIPFAFDAHVSLMSLPSALGIAESDLTGEPYLSAEGTKGTKGTNGLPRIGICTRGNPGHGNDKARSLPDEVAAEILKGAPPEAWTVLSPNNPDIRNWTDTAQIIAGLDLVITVDTAVAHLAGAMGVPVWMLHSVSGDFRWGLESDTTPWYRSMRIYRQTKYMDWSDVIVRLCDDLGKLQDA